MREVASKDVFIDVKRSLEEERSNNGLFVPGR